MAFRRPRSSISDVLACLIDVPLSKFHPRNFPRAERHQESSSGAATARRVRFNDAKETEASIHGYSSLPLPGPFTSRERLSLLRECFDYKEEPMGEKAKNPNVGLTPLVALSPYRHHDVEVSLFRVCVRRQPQELSRRVNDAAKETKASTHGNSTLYQMVAEEATNNALWPSTAKIVSVIYERLAVALSSPVLASSSQWIRYVHYTISSVIHIPSVVTPTLVSIYRAACPFTFHFRPSV
jgi:hypothetical protein